MSDRTRPLMLGYLRVLLLMTDIELADTNERTPPARRDSLCRVTGVQVLVADPDPMPPAAGTPALP